MKNFDEIFVIPTKTFGTIFDTDYAILKMTINFYLKIQAKN